MTQVNKGDTVRVVLEGEVISLGYKTFHIGGRGASSNVIDQSAGHVQSVEVVKSAKPSLKVGDTVEGTTAFEDVPIGAILVGESPLILRSQRVLVRTADGYSLPATGETKSPHAFCEPRKVVYLPES